MTGQRPGRIARVAGGRTLLSAVSLCFLVVLGRLIATAGRDVAAGPAPAYGAPGGNGGGNGRPPGQLPPGTGNAPGLQQPKNKWDTVPPGLSDNVPDPPPGGGGGGGGSGGGGGGSGGGGGGSSTPTGGGGPQNSGSGVLGIRGGGAQRGSGTGSGSGSSGAKGRTGQSPQTVIVKPGPRLGAKGHPADLSEGSGPLSARPGAAPVSSDSNPEQSSYSHQLIPPSDLDLSAENLAEGGLLAMLLAALLYLPVMIFNKATEKNHEDVTRWLERPRAWVAAATAWIPFG